MWPLEIYRLSTVFFNMFIIYHYLGSNETEVSVLLLRRSAPLDPPEAGTLVLVSVPAARGEISWRSYSRQSLLRSRRAATRCHAAVHGRSWFGTKGSSSPGNFVHFRRIRITTICVAS